MALFVKGLGFGTSILAGGLTLALVALPVIIRTSEEALKAVPRDLRRASLALGATRWQTIRLVVLPAAGSDILTGTILSIGRVAGETAPILFTAAAYFLPRLPSSVLDQVMALPYHLYVISTSGTEIEASRPLAYGTAVVLLFLVLVMNLSAVFLRQRLRGKAG
jgi:phosphate transport system permease protein